MAGFSLLDVVAVFCGELADASDDQELAFFRFCSTALNTWKPECEPTPCIFRSEGDCCGGNTF